MCKMGRIICLVISILFTLLLSPLYALDNLIMNPSFEDIGSDRLPAEWKGAGYVMSPDITGFSIDTERAHSGKASALINNYKPNHSYFLQSVQVDELSIYKFTAWILTENVDEFKSGAGISVLEKWPLCGDIRLTSPGWEFTELYVITGKGVGRINVKLNLGFYASDNTGKAWFDDITFEKADILPENATATVIDPFNDKLAEAAATGKNNFPAENPGQQLFFLIIIGCTILVISGGLYYLFHLYVQITIKSKS